MGAMFWVLLPIRLVFYLIFMILFYLLFLTLSFFTAIWRRGCTGTASKILQSGGRHREYIGGDGYWGQMLFSKPFAKAKLESVFSEICAEASVPADNIEVLFMDEKPTPEIKYGAINTDFYINEPAGNWTAVGLGGTAAKGAVLHVYNGNPGEVTLLQFFLPGNTFDGSSCFNMLKELINRYYGEPKKDVFMLGRTTMKPESAQKFDSLSFCSFLCRLPYAVFVNTHYFVWGITSCCGGPGIAPKVACINLSLEQSVQFKEGLAAKGAKPYAGICYASANAYYRVLGKWPGRLMQASSFQTRHFVPEGGEREGRDLVGDWLFAPLQYVNPGYSLKDAQAGYEAFLEDLAGPGPASIRAFNAKAYSPVAGSTGTACMVQSLPFTADDTAAFGSSIWLNNYGVRNMHPDSGFLQFNWAAPCDLGVNTINVNGITTINFASMFHGQEAVNEIRDIAMEYVNEFLTLPVTKYGATDSATELKAAKILPQDGDKTD